MTILNEPMSEYELDANRDKSAYDVVVLGAGIQGAGIAQACALNGLSVLVLEQFSEPAMGTSSKSSKLIHGGLRYLESLSFSLVKECLLERKRLLKNAPDIVKANRFFIPLYTNSKRHPLIVYMGLWLYAWLAGDYLGRKIGWICKANWKTLNGLNTENLRAVFYYEDAQTDDKLLTKRVIASAQKLGAELKYHSEVVSVVKRDNQKQNDFVITTESYGTKQHFIARICINVTGPWINTLAQRVSPSPPMLPIELVQGIHIILDRLISTECFYGESPDDGRAVFVLPWKGNTMVGTTEFALPQGPTSIGATDVEINYLLRVVNHMFPLQSISEENISEVFAGSRVLPKQDGSLNARTRETQILYGPECVNYFAVYGGKLTAYRAVAENIVNVMVKEGALSTVKLPLKTTRDISLMG